jgi:hypothetical protein
MTSDKSRALFCSHCSTDPLILSRPSGERGFSKVTDKSVLLMKFFFQVRHFFDFFKLIFYSRFSELSRPFSKWKKFVSKASPRCVFFISADQREFSFSLEDWALQSNSNHSFHHAWSQCFHPIP